jgi:hypothetical protein
MQIVVTNISSAPVYIRDLYAEIPAGGSVTTTRSGSDLSGMDGLIEALDDGTVSVSLTPTAAEIASGFLTPPQAVQAVDMAPVAATEVAAGLVILRVALPAGVGGAPDDVTAYAANALPYKFRVLDAWAMVATGVALANLNVYTRAAGAGTLLAGPIDATAAHIARITGPTVSALAVPGTTEGLFVRRSDSAIVGELFLLVRREN